MYDDIVSYLAALGYTVIDADTWMINFILEKVTNEIKNFCNITEIPDGLHQIAVQMVCGEFLQSKNVNGQLDGIVLSPVIKQIKEGDTSITYAVKDSATGTIEGLINDLLISGKNQLVKYRKLVW